VTDATVPHPWQAAAEALLLVAVVLAGVLAVAVVFGLPGQRAATLFCVNLCAVLAIQVFSGTSGVVSFGHTAFMLVGAYVSAWVTMPATMLGRSLPELPGWMGGYELPGSLGLLLAAVVGAALALGSGLAIARLSGASGAIATLGFLIIVYTVMAAAQHLTGGNRAFWGIPRTTDLWIAAAAAAGFLLVARLFRDGRTGLMLRAARDNEPAARALGIDPGRMRLRAWVLSGALAAMAGALYGHMLGAFTPRDFYFDLVFGLVAMMIVGGMGTVTGAVGGTALVMALQEGLQRLEGGVTLGPVSLPALFGLPTVGVSLAMLAVLLFRPAGLFGRRELPFPLPRRRAPPPPAPVSGAGGARLVIDRLGKQFAGLVALQDVSATIPAGRITGLIGPNGAGKSTLVNAVTGLGAATSGRITMGSSDLTHATPERVARAGIARSFQNIRLFGGLSVEENVAVPALARGLPAAVARATAARELAHVGLASDAARPAAALAYGARRRLEIARALAAAPVFLLLDEPAAGMNPEETADLATRLRDLPADRGIGIVLIDHDLGFVMGLCNHVIVLNRGQLIAEGTPAEVQGHPGVIEAYLGTRASGVARATMTEAEHSIATGEMQHG
jgi:branched-chain amino acid transport system permease protein